MRVGGKGVRHIDLWLLLFVSPVFVFVSVSVSFVSQYVSTRQYYPPLITWTVLGLYLPALGLYLTPLDTPIL